METMSVLSRILGLACTLKSCKWGSQVRDRKELKLRQLTWLPHCGCDFVSFVMYISGAEFEEHPLNIYRDIPNLNNAETTDYNISKTKQNIPKRKMLLFCNFENTIIKYKAIIFQVIKTLS